MKNAFQIFIILFLTMICMLLFYQNYQTSLYMEDTLDKLDKQISNTNNLPNKFYLENYNSSELEEFGDIMSIYQVSRYLSIYDDKILLDMVKKGYFKGTYFVTSSNGEDKYCFVKEKLYEWCKENTVD